MAVLLTLFDLVFFAGGIFFLYGGPDGKAFCADVFLGTALSAIVSVMAAMAVLAIFQFDKRLLLASLILHETVLLLFFIPMAIATIICKDMPQIMVHPIVLLALLGMGGGIFQTVKSMKNKCVA